METKGVYLLEAVLYLGVISQKRLRDKISGGVCSEKGFHKQWIDTVFLAWYCNIAHAVMAEHDRICTSNTADEYQLLMLGTTINLITANIILSLS